MTARVVHWRSTRDGNGTKLSLPGCDRSKVIILKILTLHSLEGKNSTVGGQIKAGISWSEGEVWSHTIFCNYLNILVYNKLISKKVVQSEVLQ